MLKGLDNNTSIKDFVTIIDKEIVKLKDTDSPQEHKRISTKSTPPKDASDSNKVKTPKTMLKQTHDKNCQIKGYNWEHKSQNPLGSITITIQRMMINIKVWALKEMPHPAKPTRRQSWEKTKGYDHLMQQILDYLESNNTFDVSDPNQAHSTPSTIWRW